jgi:hypothetical protein
MTDPQPRLFTIQEANELLPILRPLMREALEIRQKILALQAEVWPVIEKALGNGGSLVASRAVQEFERLNLIVHQIQDLGAIIKDINSGLLDFPALREGREIYLCWKYGEDQIEFWHDIEAGFAGRQPW